MSNRFYTCESLQLGEVSLGADEAHHLATVKRHGVTDRVTLFNGDGHEYPAEVVAVSKRSAVLRVTNVVALDRELAFELVIGSALPKGDRADFMMEKLTELGVTRFVPLVTDRSIVQPKESKVDKYQRMVIEASKQCGRNRLMAVERPEPWASFVSRTDLPGLRLVLHPNATVSAVSPADHDSRSVSTGLVVGVGPEGGFTDEEVARATLAGWRVLGWGHRIMRVETAAVAVAAWIAAISSPVSGGSRTPP